MQAVPPLAGAGVATASARSCSAAEAAEPCSSPPFLPLASCAPRGSQVSVGGNDRFPQPQHLSPLFFLAATESRQCLWFCSRAGGLQATLLRRLRAPAVPSIRAADLDSGPVWVWLSAAVPGKALFCVLKIDTLSHRVRPCASPAPKNKSVLVACSLERYARHTQTVNLYAPLTLPVGHTRGRPCPQVWSGGRLAGLRCRTCLPYACV